MEDLKDRTINELVESYPMLVDTLNQKYDVLMNIIDIIFSSCSIKLKLKDFICIKNIYIMKPLIASLKIKYIK